MEKRHKHTAYKSTRVNRRQSSNIKQCNAAQAKYVYRLHFHSTESYICIGFILRPHTTTSKIITHHRGREHIWQMVYTLTTRCSTQKKKNKILTTFRIIKFCLFFFFFFFFTFSMKSFFLQMVQSSLLFAGSYIQSRAERLFLVPNVHV